jgi:predicted TIM-barrel fold metal-dependent hydrolase
MIIDFHAHLYNRDWLPEKFWRGMVNRAVAVRKRSGEEVSPEAIEKVIFSRFEDPTGEVLVQEMKEAGIGVTQIMPLDLGLELGEPPVSIEEKNDKIAQVARAHAPRIRAYFGIDPNRPGGVALFEKAVKEWGMKGLKLDPASGFYPNEPFVYPYYEKAVELGVPVLLHTGAAIPPFRNKYCDPIYLDDVTLDFPDLTVIAAHVGFGWWQQLSFMMNRKTNLLADISGWQTIARDDHLFCRYFRDMLSLGGSENFLFATDGPSFRLYSLGNKEWANLIRNLPENAPSGTRFSPEEIENVLYKNAMRVMKIKDLKEIEK